LANSSVIIFSEEKRAIAFINAYAPEHLILAVKNADDVAAEIYNAGSVFLGNFSPEAIGDYASGTNHTLPTNGYAKAYAGVSLESFVKYMTFQRVTREGIKNLGPVVEQMAEAEQLIGHKIAIEVRLNDIKTRN
jgi:histidinol dehydrogenase